MKVFAGVVYLLEYKQYNIKVMEIQNRTFKQGGAYESPSLTALDVMSEGLLCVSGNFTLGGGGIYEDGDINDNGEY